MYQRVVSAYNEPDRKRGKKLMEEVINIITASDLPKALIEVKGLGETLKKYAESILAYFDRPGTSNRSEENTSELQSLMRISYAVFCLTKNNKKHTSGKIK